jgi:hypothetical protein
MKRNSQKKRNIHRSSLKQKKKVQHGGEHNFTYNEIIGDNSQYTKQYFVELLSKIIKKPDEVYNLLTLKESLSLGQFQNVLKTFFLTPREIEGTTRLTGNTFGPLTQESNAVVNFKEKTKITNISGLQMAILYGHYELIEQLFYYKLPDKKHSVITPDMYNSFYKNINDIIDTTRNVVTSQSEVVKNSNALHLVFTCGVNIENTPFIQSASEIAKLRHFSKMYLIKQLFHKINENWYKVTPATPDSATPEPEYGDMKKKLLDMLNELQTKYVNNYNNPTAKTKLTEFINQYKGVLDTQEGNADTNIKKLYNVVVHKNDDFIIAITSTAFMDSLSLSRSKPGDTKSTSDNINKYYNEFFEQLKKDYLTIINHEKDNHPPGLNNSEFMKEYEKLKLKQENKFLPEIENNDEYIDFVIYKQFMWNGTKSILLPNANDEIIKLNDTDYKLEYEGSLKTVILPGTNEINKKIITEDNENIEESKKINIITLSSQSSVTVDEEFIITSIEIPEKSASSQEESEIESQQGSSQERPEVKEESE